MEAVEDRKVSMGTERGVKMVSNWECYVMGTFANLRLQLEVKQSFDI